MNRTMNSAKRVVFVRSTPAGKGREPPTGRKPVASEEASSAPRATGSSWYGLRPQPLAEVDAWLEPYREYWSGRLDALEQHLEENPE
jgi:hypothetical protein